MTKITKILLILLAPIIIFVAININKTKQNCLILSENGTPSKNLITLLDTLNIKHDGTLKSIVDATQKEWLRKPGQERWDIDDKYSDQRKTIISSFEKFGMTQDVNNSKNKYKYALLLGATAPTVKLRLNYLIEKWKNGLRFENLIFLGSQRPLKQFEKDFLGKENNKLKTETDMIRFIFEQIDLPKDIPKINAIFIDSQMKQTPKEKIIRPTTGDTIRDWLKIKPPPGSCIAISNQPYVKYQQSTLKTILPPEFEVETIGTGIKNKQKINISNLLDNLSRFLYQENKRK